MTLTEYITTKEAAKVSGYHPNHVRLLVRTRKVRGYKFGNMWMVAKRSFEDYLEQVGRESNGRYGPREPVSF